MVVVVEVVVNWGEGVYKIEPERTVRLNASTDLPLHSAVLATHGGRSFRYSVHIIILGGTGHVPTTNQPGAT